ncbi:MAG: restriction endonuclease subunit S [Synechococcaceae cyanobacterium]
MSEPQYAPLEEWMESIFDYRGKTPEKTTAGIPLITAKVIKGGRIETPSEFIAPDAYDEWMRRGMPEAGDVVITTEAPLGEVAQLPKGKVALAQRVITLRGKKGLVDNTFLKYLLLSRPFQEDLEARATGTTVVGIKQSVLRKIDLAFPSFLDQKAIAHILGTLDDKIELNRKTNETLEAMAKALFKSWFVDFDPVRAKAEVRPTGLPGEISDLFPDSLVESELGEIPSGWGVAAVGDLVYCVGGSTPSTSEPSYWDGGENLWATPKDLSSLPAPFLLDTAKMITESGIRRISSGVLPVGSVLLSSRAPVGYVAVTCVPVSINQGFIALMSNELMPSAFLLNWCLSNVQQFKDRASGTTFAEISKAAFRPIPILVPDQRITKLFAKESQSLYDRIVSSMKQSDLLESCRDTLLPKLISGEIRIPDAEKLLEEADV